jgi:hypothetical protein
MSELDSIIQVTIRRDTATVETAAFDVPLILATHTNFMERAKVYTDITAIEEDFNSSTIVWKMADNLFGQDIGRPFQIVVGRRQVNSVVGTVPTVVVGKTYSIIVNGTTYSYVATTGNSASAVVAGIKVQYDLAPKVGIAMVNNLDGSFNIGVSVSGTAWSIKVTDGIILENTTPTETYVDARSAVKQENDVWYALVADTHVDADILALAAATEADKKIYATSTQDDTSITNGTTDVIAKLFNLNYSRTFCTYLPTANTEYPEAAWVGGVLPQVVGSADWDFKRASGITVSKITDTARTNLRNKHGNMFTRVAGQNIFQDGNMADGRPIYEIIIKDWIEARMKESIFFRLVNSLKIPYTRKGFAVIESEMRSVLAQGVGNSALDTFSVVSPDPLSVPDNLRTQGIAGTFTFTARYSGSVRTIVIRGNLTV